MSFFSLLTSTPIYPVSVVSCKHSDGKIQAGVGGGSILGSLTG